jgi:hypothetical protein
LDADTGHGEGKVEIDIIGAALDRTIDLEGAELARLALAEAGELEHLRGIRGGQIELQIIARILGQADDAARDRALAAADVLRAGIGDGELAAKECALEMEPAHGLAIEGQAARPEVEIGVEIRQGCQGRQRRGLLRRNRGGVGDST